MTKKQSQKLAMYMAVLHILRNHPSLIESAPALETLIAELERQVAGIQHTAARRRNIRKGVGLTKATSRVDLIQRAFAVSKAIQSWAEQQGDAQTAARHNASISALRRVRHVELPALATTVLEEARGLGAALLPFSVDEARLSALEAAIANFQDMLSRPRAAVADQRLATETLIQLFREADQLLYGRMDALLLALRDAGFADVHSMYGTARRIAGARRTSGAPVPEASDAPVPADPAGTGLMARLPRAAW